MSIGFRPQPSSPRVPYFDVTGHRLGYILTRDGHDYAQYNDGTIVAKILRYKGRHVRYPDVNAYGGATIPILSW